MHLVGLGVIHPQQHPCPYGLALVELYESAEVIGQQSINLTSPRSIISYQFIYLLLGFLHMVKKLQGLAPCGFILEESLDALEDQSEVFSCTSRGHFQSEHQIHCYKLRDMDVLPSLRLIEARL